MRYQMLSENVFLLMISLCIPIVDIDIDINTPAVPQIHTFLAHFLSFINMQALENSSVLNYNQ